MHKFKEKSLEAIRLGYRDPTELTVYEGAIRSAKTFTSLWDWDAYVLDCPEKVFLMSGNTLGSLTRNCLEGEFGWLSITGGLARLARDSDGSRLIRYGDKIVYLMGAHDAASFRKLRGLSIGGWYADEINLHDKAFIETALGRSFASRWIRNIFTLNPDIPSHWFYKDPTIGIDRFKADYVPKLYRHFHFTLDDNPAITDERRAIIAQQYTGVFYKRYILGLRVRGEGGCYPSFVGNAPGVDGNILEERPRNAWRTTLAIDVGGHGSATAMAAIDWFALPDGRPAIAVADEHYDRENKSVESVTNNWRNFVARQVLSGKQIDRAFCDSAEQLIKKTLCAAPSLEVAGRLIQMPHVEDSMKRPIRDRIRLFDLLFAQRRAFIVRSCTKTIEAFENAVWNEKAPPSVEERLDDGTTNIDSLDAAEYAVERDASMLVDTMR